MEIKVYSAFSKATELLKASPSDCLVSYPGHMFGESYASVEMQSVYSVAPADWTTLLGGVLPLCWYAVGLFCCPSWLDHTPWGSLTPLLRCSRCLLLPQPIGPHSLGESYPSAEMQSVFTVAPADWAALLGGVLPLCRDSVGIFCGSSCLGQLFLWCNVNSRKWPEFKFWTKLFTSHTALNTIGKGMNPTILFPSIDK